MEESKKTKRYRGGLLLRFAVICLAAVILLSLIERQIQLAEKKDRLEVLQGQLADQNQKNQELRNSLENDEGMKEYAEKRARRDMDYAKPNERVYIDVGGGD